MKSWVVHYKNKYPDAIVSHSDDAVDVYSKDGEHLVALRKDGAGMFGCRSLELGCRDSHDLAPIPKQARAFKHHADGRIGKSEEHAERSAHGSQIAAKFGGRVPSVAELAASGDKEADAELSRIKREGK